MKALKIAYENDETGAPHANAIHIVKAWCYDSEGKFKVTMEIYHDQTCYEAGKKPLLYPDYEFTPESTNIGHTNDYAIGLVKDHADYASATELNI